MKERYIPALIMLIAGAITSILNIVNKVETAEGLKRLLLVLFLFYIAGLVVKAIIVKTVINAPGKEEAATEAAEGEEEGSEDGERNQPAKVQQGGQRN
ncbi:flagellar biosynthesis/type III secretory pathway M-ring protein FliF/YscJ [Anaerotaenia torta]|uniref:hypothetical protein n=1 Tax=Anaerotaenia torta TaxID=433293 RepID=UPI003D21EEE0